MVIEDYTSYKEALERYNRMPIPNVSYNIEEIKEWTWEAMEKLNAANQYVVLKDTFNIEGHRVKIPQGCVNIQRITDTGSGQEYEPLNNEEEYRLFTYKIFDGFIYTDQEDGQIDILYESFPIDDSGNPLIPDNEYYISAIEWFYRYKLATRGYFLGVLVGQQFQLAEREWHFYAAGAVNKTKMMQESRMKKFYRRTFKRMPKKE